MAAVARQSLLEMQADLFRRTLPRRPYATDELSWGIRPFPQAVAVQKRHIQPNPPSMVHWLVFDVDRADAALRWESVGLPAPTWVARNPVNGHAHLAYGLAVPVPTSDAARAAPLNLAAAIQAAFNARLDADIHYTGLICKNPLHPSWEVLWHCRGETDLYALHDLADYVDLRGLKKNRNAHLEGALGRNCALFHSLRMWAYKAVRSCWRPGGISDWQARVIAQAHAFNTFREPLPAKEVRTTARSVADWVWQRFTPVEFRAVQGRRGRRKGAQVKAGLLPVVQELRAQGLSLRAVAAEVGVSYQTVLNWQRDGEKPQANPSADKGVQALRMRKAGATIPEIALTLGVSGRRVYQLLAPPRSEACQKAISDNSARRAEGGRKW